MEFRYTDRPTIVIYLNGRVHQEQIDQICFGIEEEGIPFRIQEKESVINLVNSAHEAALESKLLVGLACDDHQVVLHYRNLKPDQFMHRLNTYSNLSNSDLRLFGSNAARLVKGSPFKKSQLLEVAF